MDIYIGIDPGSKGAICALNPISSTIEFLDFNKNTIYQLYFSLHTVYTNETVKSLVIEDVHSLYGMSAKSNFNFGRNLGILQGILGSLSLEPTKVTPKVWQAAVGVTKKGKAIKHDVAWLCHQHYPRCKINGPRGGLMDGRSDALMIAHYAYLTNKDK